MKTRTFRRPRLLPANFVGIAGGTARAALCILAAAAFCQTASAQQRAAPPAPPPPTTPQAGAPAISAQAERLIKELGAYIGSAQEFTFHADITFDHVLPSGQKLQFSAGEDVWLHRPGRVRVDWNGDLGSRRFWYSGNTVTVWDPATPFYASQAAPGDIDTMLEMILKQLNFSPPLVDLLYSDPYKNVRANLQYGIDLGDNDVNGRSCRTLAFVEKSIDWQIWIENGPQLTPCKLVITYKTQVAQPQFRAVFTKWDFSPRIADAVFTPNLPAGIEKIPFQTVAAKR